MDELVRLWDVRTGKLFGTPLPHPEVVALAFSPDGKVLLPGNGANTAWLWDVATGQPLGPPLPLRGGVTVALISPDGRTAATTSDRSVPLWDAAARHQLGPPLGHPSPLAAATFSPDSQVLVTGGDDGLCAPGSYRRLRPGTWPSCASGVEVLTGMQMGDPGAMRELDAAAWADHRDPLEQTAPEPIAPARPLR